MQHENLKVAKLVRVFIAEEDTFKEIPLYKFILEWCMNNKISGATVFRGIAGYGHHKKLRQHFLFPKKDLPIIVEIIEEPHKVEKVLLPFLKEVVKEGLITIETVYIVK